MLGEFTGQEETDGCLDFPAGDGGPLVVVSQSGRLGCYTLEDVVDEAVHDAHGLAGDASVGMNLLQNFVDVDAVTFFPPFPLLLVPRSLGLRLGGGFL